MNKASPAGPELHGEPAQLVEGPGNDESPGLVLRHWQALESVIH